VDGQRTVRRVIHSSGYDQFSVYKVFYSLVSSALMEKADLPRAKTRSAASDYTGIITLYTDILQVIRRSIDQDQHILGAKINANMLDEIDNLPGYLDQYQSGSSNRDRILTTVKAILGKAQQQVTQRGQGPAKRRTVEPVQKGLASTSLICWRSDGPHRPERAGPP
jgi:hypothetical protein